MRATCYILYLKAQAHVTVEKSRQLQEWAQLNEEKRLIAIRKEEMKFELEREKVLGPFCNQRPILFLMCTSKFLIQTFDGFVLEMCANCLRVSKSACCTR